jgi:hypothetical protein
MAEWRREHPRATLTEIEEALDGRLLDLRARVLEDVVAASAAASFAGMAKRDRPRCPLCDEPLTSRGEAERRLQTSGGREIRVRRSYGQCPRCGLSLFPPR